MKKDEKFQIVKDIPLPNGQKILKGRTLYRSHGCYYLDGGLMSPAYQKNFDELIEYEENTEWQYVVPIITKTGNSII